MAAPKSSPEHITSCLTDLRRVFGIGQKTTPEHLSWQNGLYIEALQDLEPRLIEAACKYLIREGDRFPKPKDIREAAKELSERRSARVALANPLPEADMAALMRNEVILLLGMYRVRASDLTGDPSWEFKNFIAAAANAWAKIRPVGGLEEVDKARNGRRSYGFAMEAWARAYLRDVPVHPAYVTADCRTLYRHMTGHEIETLKPEDDPLLKVDHGLGETAMRAAKRAAE